MMTIKSGKIFFVAVATIIISACNTNNININADKKTHTDSNEVAVYTFQAEHGFGYTIFINGKEFIHQDCIPVIQGNKPFASKGQAKKTGDLVAQKIRSKQLPTLTLDELNKLGVIQQ